MSAGTDNADGGGSLEDRNRQSDLAVMDAQEYKQKRRLRRILDAHDRVEDRASEAFELYSLGEINRHGKNTVLLQAVKQYIREVFQLLRLYEQDADTGEKSYLYRNEGQNILGRIEMEHDPDVVFEGLADVLLADPTYVETWEEEFEQRHGASRTETYQREYSVPETISWKAYLEVNEFLTEQHSLELQFEALEDKLPEWGFTEIPEDEADDQLPDDVEVL
jgi:hypothetical protein